MKNMKSKITNIFLSGMQKVSLSGKTNVSLSGLTRQSFFFILLLTFASCSNLFNKDVTETNDSNTYVMLTSDSVSVRSISPTQEYALEKLKSITFSAKKDGKSKRILASGVASLSVLYNYQFVLPDGDGFYTFELQGTLDNVNYYAKLTDIEIKERETTPIRFALKPVKDVSNYSEFEDFGGISCTLNFNKTNVKKIHYKLENLSSSNIVEQGDITSFSNISNSSYNSKATYNHLANNTTGATARLPVGQYRLTFDFLTEDTSLNDFVVINSFPYIVNVEKGRNSYLEENFDLSQVYTITYNANGGSLDLGSRMQTKFTSKNEVMLPRMQKDGFTFQGWYTTSTCAEGTGPIEEVETGTTENKTFYAKFADSAIYVDPTATNTNNDGSKDNPVKNLRAAIELIQAQDIETTNQSNLLNWYIFVKGTITESLVISLNEDQMALPLKAKGVTFVGASDLKNGEPQDVIQGDGTHPVFTIATSTQVHFKNIKITGGIDSEGYDGAGIVMKGNSIVTIEDGTLITGNTASTNGGGIAVFDNANLMLAGGEITGNTCGTDKHGNDIYCSDSGHISVCGNPVIDDLYMPNSVTLLDNMTAGASITITPADYVIPHYEDSEGGYIYKAQVIHVVEGSGISISDNSKYFHITPESDDNTKEWSIDSEGCLNLPCTVSFANLGDGGALEPITVLCKELESGDLPVPEEREGYIFTGWYYKEADWQNNYKMKPVEVKEGYYDEDGYFYKTNVPTAIVEDMTLYAGWMTTSNNIYIDAADGIDYASIESSGEDTSIKFGSGTEEEPLQNIKEALNVIRKINDNQEDYTLTIRHSSGEYNIYIDDTIPAKSLTIQGSEEGTTEDPDGFSSSSYHDDYSYQIRVSTQIPVTFQNLTITNKLWGYTTDGPVMNITNGANVTLGNKAVIKGANSIYGGGKAPLGAIAVEEDSTLTMLEGSLIDTFYIRNGAVYVKEGGKFIMEGGTITHINSHNTGGAVYVEGGTKVISGANFEMKGGSITGNETASVYNTNITTNLHGAGVCVVSGSFEMSGGEITNNTAHVSEVDWSTAAGGGVFVYADASFAMSDGEISGNKAVKTYVNNSNETVEGPNASAYGGGVCLQASGNKLASFTMTGGTISGNTAGTSGNGIGFLGSLAQGVTGTIKFGADALITPDNDVYLPSFVTITITDPLTNDDDNPKKATITPQEYKANHPILNEESVNLAAEYSYFAVTPGTTTWTINEEGKLVSSGTGNNFYVDTDGDDENSGLDAEHPLKTIMAAIGKMDDPNTDYVINVMGNLWTDNFAPDYDPFEITDAINGKAQSITLRGNAESGTYSLDGQSGEDPTTVMKVTTSVPIILEGIRVTGGRANDTHLGGAIYIGEESTVILGQDTIVNGGGDHGCGSAIYVAASDNGGVTKAGSLIIKDNAVVNADDYGEVYLCTGATIKVASALTGESSVYDSDSGENIPSPIVAKITPQVYAENTPVIALADDAPATLNISDVYEKFAVFEEDTTSWLITNEGKLAKASSGGNVPDDFVLVAGAEIITPPQNYSSGGSFAYASSSDPVIVPSFYMCKHEVTQEEYEKYCCYGVKSPSETNNKNEYPAYYISWYDAIVYCNLRSIAENLQPVYSIKVSTQGSTEKTTDPTNWDGVIPEGSKYRGPDERTVSWEWVAASPGYESIDINPDATGYRLPTAAEWEYAARGGNGLQGPQTKYSGSSEIEEVSFDDYDIHRIQLKKANTLGIFDMSGSVSEWLWDVAGEDYRTVSPLNDYIDSTSSAYPYERDHGYNNYIGFRVVRNAGANSGSNP